MHGIERRRRRAWDSVRALLFRAPPPQDVELGADEDVIEREGGSLVVRLAESDEDWAVDGSRVVLLRAYEWDPRRSIWTFVGKLNGMWFASEHRFGIADVEVFGGHRSHGHGSRLLLSCLSIAQSLGADVVTGNLSAVDDVGRLKLWYARFGFVVGPPREAGMLASVAWTPPRSARGSAQSECLGGLRANRRGRGAGGQG